MNRRQRIISGIVALAVIIGVGVYTILKPITSPENVQQTDLRAIKKDEVQHYVDQLSTTISNLPETLTTATTAKLQNQLGYILREKYGSNTLTGEARGDMLTDVHDISTLYIDIRDKNETYQASFKNDGSDVSIFCAPQEVQLDPQASQCITAPADDSYQFRNG
jgi:hypothetical protein